MTKRYTQVLFERIIARKREYRVFHADSLALGDASSEEIGVYDFSRPPSISLMNRYRAHMGSRSRWLMFRRMKQKEAVLLVLEENGLLAGIGWIQQWRPLLREFWWLANGGVALGPFWTNPELRGRGIYGRLLARAAREAQQRGWHPLFIWAESSNAASIRGIEKAGFESLGTHRVHTYLLGAIRRHYVVEDPMHAARTPSPIGAKS